MSDDIPISSSENSAVVCVVDDDPPQREAMCDLFRSVGLRCESFSAAKALLEADLPDGQCCLVLDVRLPGMSGLEVQEHLNQVGRRMPIIFITGFADVPMSVRAMKGGAADFLTKPVRDQDLLDAVHRAIDSDRVRRAGRGDLKRLLELYATLTEREKEVMALVSAGLMNKQIGGRLGLSDVTVKMHRGQVMRKMKARSLAALVRMNDQIKLEQA